MKAPNFLERIKELSLLYNLGKITAEQYAKAIVKAIEFYSQPFKPEMITEYFEGWIKNAEFGYALGDSRCNIVTWHKEEPPIYINLYYKNINYPKVDDYKMKCITLDNFITDCQRAGIERTFKQEIINKYFK